MITASNNLYLLLYSTTTPSWSQLFFSLTLTISFFPGCICKHRNAHSGPLPSGILPSWKSLCCKQSIIYGSLVSPPCHDDEQLWWMDTYSGTLHGLHWQWTAWLCATTQFDEQCTSKQELDDREKQVFT